MSRVASRRFVAAVLSLVLVGSACALSPLLAAKAGHAMPCCARTACHGQSLRAVCCSPAQTPDASTQPASTFKPGPTLIHTGQFATAPGVANAAAAFDAQSTHELERLKRPHAPPYLLDSAFLI